MTIHQAKGLEFPVVVVGCARQAAGGSPKQIDRDLGRFYHRPPFEPREPDHGVRPDAAALRRLLAAGEGARADERRTAQACFAPIWQGLPQWPYVERDVLAAQRFELKNRIPVKKAYSFTGDFESTRPARASTSSSATTTSRRRARR